MTLNLVVWTTSVLGFKFISTEPSIFFCIRSQPVKLNIYYLDKCNHVKWVKLGVAIMYVFFNYIDNWDCLPYTISFRLCTIEVVFHSLKWRSSSICLKIKVAFDLLEKCGLFRPVRQGRKEAKWMLSLQANWKDRQTGIRPRQVLRGCASKD